MTECVSGEHDFPDEDETGAYCEEHGVTMLFHGPPITPGDLAGGSPPAIPQRDH
ncbi:hypothetical protein [Streptomyces sp. NPDC051569]|uniref:hypothetical protein n=1 Tax=Streptomyces sp. NPDC051569 TaxID=3365661 RepID=UPI0037B8BA59